MFPLGSVLLPGNPLALRVFEERYLALVSECVAGAGVFGVVLIERGSEVGGGDVRTNVGTLASIREVGLDEDGHLSVMAVGTSRFEVERWLPDDPYPTAEIAPLDEPNDPVDLGPVVRRLEAITDHVEGIVWSPSGDAVADLYRLAGLLGPLDAHRVLAADSLAERATLVVDGLDAHLALLRSGWVG